MRQVVSSSVTYRGYELAVHMPSRSGTGWLVLIWQPNNGTPIIMPDLQPRDAAISAAQGAVDELLDGRAAAAG